MSGARKGDWGRRRRSERGQRRPWSGGRVVGLSVCQERPQSRAGSGERSVKMTLQTALSRVRAPPPLAEWGRGEGSAGSRGQPEGEPPRGAGNNNPGGCGGRRRPQRPATLFLPLWVHRSSVFLKIERSVPFPPVSPTLAFPTLEDVLVATSAMQYPLVAQKQK